jgi:hypothetical protein
MNKSINKDGIGHNIVCYEDSDENEADSNTLIRFLLSERVYGFPSTSGSVLSNYWQFIRNNHPLLSICLMHTKNPFPRKKRVIVFICTFSFSIFLTFLLMEKAKLIPWVSTCQSGCNQHLGNNRFLSGFFFEIQNLSNENSTSSANGDSYVCMGGSNDGMKYSEYNKQCIFFEFLNFNFQISKF